jgi:hypothetical protein
MAEHCVESGPNGIWQWDVFSTVPFQGLATGAPTGFEPSFESRSRFR